MATLFSSAIEAPWCYLEFGDVGWCRSPARLDSRLHQAAMKIASAELAAIGCRPNAGSLGLCVPGGSAQGGALERSATLLREANTNGAIFLALPANGPARNSINEQGSLLRTICQSSDATRCTGATAAQAQFRTNGGTWSRVGGLLLILAGVLGMLLLFGFIALRLLGAAIFSLLYLLLAPAAILAPALGETGRAVFRRWAAHLLSAVVSKLLFSLLLGAVLAVLAILASLEGLGWWTQWLLMSAFWWGAYARRHQALAVAEGAVGRERGRGPHTTRRRVTGRFDPPHAMRRVASHARERFSAARAELMQRERHQAASRKAGTEATDEQARRMLESQRRDARRRVQSEAETEVRLAAKRARLARLKREREGAFMARNTRRETELRWRSRSVEREVDSEQREIDTARRLLDAEPASSRKGGVLAPEETRERGAFLDTQARLPSSRRAARSRSGERRDYPQLAFLLGVGRERYRQLSPPEQRMVRLEIDRELSLRRQLRPTPVEPPAGGSPERPRVRPTGAVAADRAGAHRPSVLPRTGRTEPTGEGSAVESTVMRDAREVAARRKRQLGLNRP